MVAGVCAVLSLTSCLAPTRSDLADRINVCGQQYKAKATVVTVEKQPQWLITEPRTCVDHPVLSPQPHPRGEAMKKQELAPIKTVVMGVLQGLPRFVPPGQSIPAAGIAVVAPVLPVLSSNPWLLWVVDRVHRCELVKMAARLCVR